MLGASAGFGAELRSERERRGVSLERMCAETKVNPRHFEALEHGDFLALPGGVFRKGIAKAYITSVGLDEQAWMQRFLASYAEQAGGTALTEDEAWVTFAENVKKGRGAQRRHDTVRWLGVMALLLMVLASAWAVWHFELRMLLRG